MKKLLSLTLALIMALSLTTAALAADTKAQIQPPTAPTSPTTFSDVPQSHWAHPIISGFAAEGITFLAKGTTFAPSQPMDRQTVVYGLAQAMGITYASSTDTGFTDVSTTDITAPYIRWARDNEVVNGTSETAFSPESYVTRQDLATILGRYAEKYSINLPTSNSVTKFTDANSISNYAAPYVQMLQEAGIIGGYPDGSFKPRNQVTNAEVATMLWRFSGRKLVEQPAKLTFPDLSGPEVWWESSIYQQMLDYADTKEGVTYHVEVASDQVTIYLGAEWPVMQYAKLVFSASGITHTEFTWSQNSNTFIDRGTGHPTRRAILFHYIDETEGDYNYYKDRDPWNTTPATVKFPWE